MFSSEKRRLGGHLIPLYNSLKGECGELGAGLLCCDCRERTRGNGLQLGQGRLRLGITYIFSLLRWSATVISCPGEVVQSPFLEGFKKHLDLALGVV